MKPAENIEKLIKNIKINTNAKMDEAVLNNTLKTLEKSKTKNSAVPQPNIWRTIMKSPITKLAAAAVIIIAIVVGIHQLGGSMDGTSVAFADVIQPLLTAETGSFKMTIDVVDSGLDWINCGDETVQAIEVVFAGPGRTRWDIPTGEVLIANMWEGKVMILQPAKMQAAVMQVGPPGVIPPHNRFNKLLELRRLIQYVLDAEDADEDYVQFLGEREIDGVTSMGFHITVPVHHGDITVWADVESKLPIRIEQTMGKQTALVSNIAYDIELDESLFSVEPPEGYSVPTSEAEIEAEDEQPQFVVTGIVTDAETGQPIEGAKVSDDGYGPEPYRGAVTNTEGRYSYTTWPEEHAIVAEAPGYKPQRKGITGGLFHTANEEAQVIDFALERE